MRRLVPSLAIVLSFIACGDPVETRGDPEAGAVIVDQLDDGCGLCHTLESAGFSGKAAPNLDQVQPGFQRVLDALRQGPGMMPSYSDRLTDRQMQDVAAFVSREAGS